jgi:hypothetical protein
MNELKDLGYANGWKEDPEIVKKCQHVKEVKNIGNHLIEFRCEICGYKFKVDSSG